MNEFRRIVVGSASFVAIFSIVALFLMWCAWIVGKLGLIFGLLIGVGLCPTPLILPFVTWIFDGAANALHFVVWAVFVASAGVSVLGDY